MNNIYLRRLLTVIILIISANTYSGHTIRVGLKYESQSGLRASGCALYQDANGNIDNNTMSCYLFDDDKCRIKTFSLEGEPKTPYINWMVPKDASNIDIQCGFNNVEKSNEIYQRLALNNVLSGASPKTPVQFEYNVDYLNKYCGGAAVITQMILINNNANIYPGGLNSPLCKHSFIGYRTTELTSTGCNLDGDYVTCYHIGESTCKKRVYAINGAAVGEAENLSNCGLGNSSISQPIYDSFDILKVGANPSNVPVFNAYLANLGGASQPLYLNVKYSDDFNRDIPSLDKNPHNYKFGTDKLWGRAIGCAPHPDSPTTQYRCYVLNNYNCSYTDIAKNGALIQSNTVIPNCGYYEFIDQTQAIYDSMTITRLGQAPVAKHTDNMYYSTQESNRISVQNYNSFYDIIYAKYYFGALLSYKLASDIRRDISSLKNYTAVGCKNLPGEPYYAECFIMMSNLCQKIKVAKNGAPDPAGWKNIDECGYDVYPVQTLALYNDLNQNDVSKAKILFGSPPVVSRSIFTLSANGEQTYLNIDGITQAAYSGGLSVGCKLKQPDDNTFTEIDCVSFFNNRCQKFTFSAFGGVIIKPNTDGIGRITDYTCGYNNYDIAKSIWDELDPNFRIGNAPSPNDVDFQVVQLGTLYTLFINGYRDNYYVLGNAGNPADIFNPGAAMGCRIITDPALCTRTNSDGSTTQFTDCVQCIGFHKDRCEAQEYTRTGYPLRNKYNYVHPDGQQCKLINLSEDYTAEVDLYNTLGPETSGSPLTLLGSALSIINITTEFGLGAGTTSEDLKEKYRLKINGKEILSGNKGVACLKSSPSSKFIACYRFDQSTCSGIEIWKSGYFKGNLTGTSVQNCGYAYYGSSENLDNILANIDSTHELREDISQSASFEAVYDENYVDTANPPNLFKKYYVKAEGVSDLAFVATRGIGCSPEAVVNGVAQRECIAFDQFNCYKRRYTRFGLAIDANWTIKQADCGYGYKATAASLYDALDPLVRAGEHPNNAPSGVQGKMKNILGSDKYIVSVFGADLEEGIFSKAVGCKPPGLDIDSGDPEKDIKMECIGFNEGSTFKRVFYTSGIAATTWKALQNVACDPVLTNVVDCPYNSDLIKQEYCKVKNTGTLATSGDPAGLSCP